MNALARACTFARRVVVSNVVTIVFLIICGAALVIAKQPAAYISSELTTRLFRNLVLILSLLIPVWAGMGLNFSIVLGAMAGQAGIIFIMNFNLAGWVGLSVCLLVSGLLAVFLGMLTGCLFNMTKGQEMITGMILGFFANGLYQLFFMYICGPLIPISNPVIRLPSGVGIVGTMTLNKGFKGIFDNIMKITLDQALNGFFIVLTLGMLFRMALVCYRQRRAPSLSATTPLIASIAVSGIYFYSLNAFPKFSMMCKFTDIPVGTAAIVILVCVFIQFLAHTKLGSDIQAVGQNRAVAASSGINVDKTRVIAVVFSTVLAALGQIIYLQNLGTFSTYSAHDQVGTFSIAALLVGGASIKKAGIAHSILGALLFHTIFIISPIAGKNLLNDAQYGEFFRVFVSYAVIAIALALYAWKTGMLERQPETVADEPLK